MPFVPTVENNETDAFLTASPTELLKQKKYSDVPFLTGMNNREGMITLLPDIVTKGNNFTKYIELMHKQKLATHFDLVT